MQDGKEAKKDEAIREKRRISGNWTKYGKFMVKTTFGKKSDHIRDAEERRKNLT